MNAKYAKDEGYREARISAQRARYLRMLAEVQGIKESGRCADCGQRFPGRPEVMDFDHVRGEKRGDVASLIKNGARASVLAEIEKCDLVCANCHRTRTKNRLAEGRRSANIVCIPEITD